SPPFLPRDVPGGGGQRSGDDYNLSPSMSNNILGYGGGAGSLASPERSSPYRQGLPPPPMPPPPPLPNEQRPHFLGRSYVSASSPAPSHAPSVGSFDSSNALGAILDARHRGSSNGFVRGGGGGGGGGGRVGSGSGIAPPHHGSNSSRRRPDQDLSPQGDNTGDAGAGAASSAMHARQQYGKAFSDHQGMRFLPPPSGGGGGLRLSSEELYGNSEAAASAAAARWRGGVDTDDDNAGGGGSADRSDPGVSRWRTGGGDRGSTAGEG
ncbi:unnamed protein product, partial [Ectocarpus sp. 8 AP-2014]